MGNCAEDTAKKYEISREEQDRYARASYTKSAKATEDGILGREIVAVSVPSTKKGNPAEVITKDEEFSRLVFGMDAKNGTKRMGGGVRS